MDANLSAVLIFFGAFLALESFLSLMHYWHSWDVPAISRVIRIGIGFILFGIGCRILPAEKLPLFVLTSFICILCMIIGALLTKIKLKAAQTGDA